MRSLLTQAAVGMLFNNVFALHDHGANVWDTEENFGIVDFLYAEKPLTAAVRAANAQCGSRNFDGILPSAGSDLHVLKFESTSAVTLACWSEIVNAAPTKIEFTAAPVRVLDYLGNTVAVTSEADGGFSVNVGDAPVYAVFPMKIADSFSLNGSTRVTGRAVSGLPAETGGVTWQTAGLSPVFTPAGALAPGGAGSAWSGWANLPVNGIASSPIRLHARLNPSGTDWVSAGFYAANDIGANGQLWIRLRATGYFTVLRAGVPLFAERVAPGFRSTGTNLIELTLDRSLNTCSLSINGFSVFTNASVGAAPVVNYAGAGFSMPATPSGPTVTAALDDFQVN